MLTYPLLQGGMFDLCWGGGAREISVIVSYFQSETEAYRSTAAL